LSVFTCVASTLSSSTLSSNHWFHNGGYVLLGSAGPNKSLDMKMMKILNHQFRHGNAMDIFHLGIRDFILNSHKYIKTRNQWDTNDNSFQF
jgi:hypothetical protein